ncbi:nuclear transport factor 2 family protein [Streptomyces sp. NPDC087659]|uniref:nuclear transport factor 2 family protein n=1 Tax=Streptomyces sp. NPDC087659 TaxID=3365801 RepID=UPI00381DFC15
MTRLPRDIARDHSKALPVDSLDGIVASFAEETLVITEGAMRRCEGVRETFTEPLTDLHGAQWTLQKMVFEGEVLLLEWEAESGVTRTDHRLDTCVFRDGVIQLRTVRYTMASATK